MLLRLHLQVRQKLTRKMRRSGFTLVEVLVALSVFLLGMLGALTVNSKSQQLSALTMTRTRAALLAQEGVEYAEAQSYDDIAPGVDVLNEPSLSAIGSEFAPFSRVVTVQYVDGSMNVSNVDHGLKLITSRVTWTAAAHDVTKLPKEFTISTLRTDL